MSAIKSIAGAIVKLIIVVAIISMALGFAAAGSEVLNPKTSAAKQREIDKDTQFKAQVHAIQLEQMTEQVQHQARADSLLEQKLTKEYELDVEYHRRKVERGLELWSIRERVFTAAGALALVIVALGVSIFLVKFGSRWSSPPHTAVQSENDRKSQADRKARMLAARVAKDPRFRETLARPIVLDQPVLSGDGRQRETILHEMDDVRQHQEHVLAFAESAN